LDAVRFRVLIPGVVIVSEKSKSAPRYVIYFSRNEMELKSCMELVVKNTLLTELFTKRLEPITSELEKVAGPPIVALPRTSKLLAITPPFAATKLPSVIISPRAPKPPREEMVPRTKRLLPVLSDPVNMPAPSTFMFPNTFIDPCVYME
jgi:hypothetical protein